MPIKTPGIVALLWLLPTIAGAADAGHFVVFDADCMSAPAPRHRHLSREAFGLPGEFYLDGLNRKLERSYGLYQPKAREDGSSPGGTVRLEVVIGGDGTLCGYRPLGQPDPALLAAAVAHLEASAPFPPMPRSIAKVADSLHLRQAWSYRARAHSTWDTHRVRVFGEGSEKGQSGGARYELAIPLP